MAQKGPKLKVPPFSMEGDRLTIGRQWERWVERFERDLRYNGVEPRDSNNVEICRMALLIYAGPDVEDLHDLAWLTFLGPEQLLK